MGQAQRPPDLDARGQPVMGNRPPDIPPDIPAQAPAQPQGRTYDGASTLGGMVGGLGGFLLAGPPGAVAGAGLGGMVGEGARQYFGSEKPADAQAAMGGMVTAGAGQALTEAIPQGIGRLFTKAAPHLMDMGLKRTAADRLKFPNTPQRLVDEGIIPRGQNVQNALSATEAKINSEAMAYDAQRPRVAGLLTAGTESIPLGARPSRSLESPAVWQRPMSPTQAPAPGRGAPPTMVDPGKIADSATAFARGQGRVGGLGSEPGPEVEEINALARQYLQQNPRPRSLQETIDQKRAYQARASYSSRPNAPTVTNNTLNFNEGVAAANRTEAIRLNPKIEADLAKERDLIGAIEAQTNAEAKATPLSTVGTAKTLLGLRNPTVMGGAAIGADRIGTVMKHPGTAAAYRAAILAAFGID
jgi:hypothetical protein